MNLKNIMDNIEFQTNTIEEVLANSEIEGIVYDSRNAGEKNIFVAMVGESFDGHSYVEDAYKRGCRVFLLEEDVEIGTDAIKLIVKNSRKALSKASANFFDHPSKKMKIIGITGTKGKTTISNYLKHVLAYAGKKVGVIGTNGIYYNGEYEPTINTTPESYELHKVFKKMVDQGVEYVAIEVSSGGLMKHRVDDVDFDIGIFNNISPDHIGPKEHPTFQHYLECKTRLFKLSRYGIVNKDDKHAGYILENGTCEFETFSIHAESDLKASNIQFSKRLDSLGGTFEFKGQEGILTCYIPSPGLFSVYNSLAVIAACKKLGIDEETIIDALKNAKVDGRVEVLPILPFATVVVDYAHNGLSLSNLLLTLKEYEPNRIICLFGSVGDKTQLRRKELGDVAAEHSDICILTSDNPDYEDPMHIINEIAKSFEHSDKVLIKEPDRKKAIEKAIELADEGDIVILAGKGHEKYQIIKGERIYFNEREIAAEAARKRLQKEE